MKIRTPEEIKAYIDGYNACYEQFCSQLKNRKSLIDVIRKMEILKAAVNNVFEDKEGEVGEGE